MANMKQHNKNKKKTKFNRENRQKKINNKMNKKYKIKQLTIYKIVILVDLLFLSTSIEIFDYFIFIYKTNKILNNNNYQS